jgi:hypothetical protein
MFIHLYSFVHVAISGMKYSLMSTVAAWGFKCPLL